MPLESIEVILPVLFVTGGAVGTLAATYPLIAWLEGRQLGKAIRVDGPDHAAKSGTPTMGGIGMLLTLALACLWLMLQVAISKDPTLDTMRSTVLQMVAALMIVVWLFAALGWIDDMQGLARRSGARELGVGLGARQMLMLQAVVGLTVGWLITRLPSALIGLEWLDSRVAAIGLIALITIGTVNGVNMSDGLDGLAAGLIGMTALSIGIVELLRRSAMLDGVPHGLQDDALVEAMAYSLGGSAGLAFVLTGACLGFLYFNRHPAKVFMGNVASMGLGAGLAVLSIVGGYWWLLPIVGLVFVAEVLSVMIQVGYFKWSGGERVFRMAPLHHHFELGGLHEMQVVRRFWAVGAVAGIAGVLVAWLAL